MEAAFQRAAQLFTAKEYQSAITTYLEIVQNDSCSVEDTVRALNNISACYTGLKDYDAALDTAKEAMSMDPLHPQAMYRAALAYEGQLHYEEALAHLRRAMTVKPDHKPYKEALERVQQRIASRRGIASEATKNQFYYEKSVRDGANAMKQKNYPEAVRLFTKAIELFSLSTSADVVRELAVLYANRSAAHLKKLDAGESVADAESSTRTDPTYARGFFRLACAREEQKEFVQAFEAAEKCLALDAAHAEAKQLIERVRPHVERSRKTSRELAEERDEQIRKLMEEREQAAKMSSGSATAGGGVASTGMPRGTGFSYSYCTYCNETGHTRDECALLRAKRRRF